jgi:hypothetical protein
MKCWWICQPVLSHQCVTNMDRLASDKRIGADIRCRAERQRRSMLSQLTRWLNHHPMSSLYRWLMHVLKSFRPPRITTNVCLSSRPERLDLMIVPRFQVRRRPHLAGLRDKSLILCLIPNIICVSRGDFRLTLADQWYKWLSDQKTHNHIDSVEILPGRA